MNHFSPDISCVMAMSLDGRIAAFVHQTDLDRRQSGFVDRADHEFLRGELIASDAVIVGADTLRASGRVWSIPNHEGVYPPWIILTKQGIDPELEFWAQEKTARYLVGPKSVASESKKLRGKVLHVFADESIASIANHVLKLLASLNEVRPIQKVTLLGGGKVNEIFFSAGLVNQLKLTICPIIIGALGAPSLVGSGVPKDIKFCLMSSHTSGNSLFLTYVIPKS